jgi:hypothetical protein
LIASTGGKSFGHVNHLFNIILVNITHGLDAFLNFFVFLVVLVAVEILNHLVLGLLVESQLVELLPLALRIFLILRVELVEAREVVIIFWVISYFLREIIP